MYMYIIFTIQELQEPDHSLLYHWIGGFDAMHPCGAKEGTDLFLKTLTASNGVGLIKLKLLRVDDTAEMILLRL